MPKYYYDDPLKAAWMQKHFGMRFVAEVERQSVMPLAHDFNFLTMTEEQMKKFGLLYVIHPDSLHMLEPDAYDVGISEGDTVCIFGDPFLEKWCRCGVLYDNAEIKEIIRRDKITFFWPEVEA